MVEITLNDHENNWATDIYVQVLTKGPYISSLMKDSTF